METRKNADIENNIRRAQTLRRLSQSTLYLFCIIKKLELCVALIRTSETGQRPLEVAFLARVVRQGESGAISGHNLSEKHIRYSGGLLQRPDLNSSNRVVMLCLVRE